MRRCLWMLLVLALPLRSDTTWRHYNLDVKLSVPQDWRITQGPVVVELSPKKEWKGERRPKFSLVWRQAPGTLEEFRAEALSSIRQKGGEVLASLPVKVSGYSSWKIQARIKDNGCLSEPPSSWFGLTSPLAILCKTRAWR